MFETGTFIVSIVAFLIMFLIIRRYGFKPLADMLEQRRQYIERQISEAEEGRAQAEALLAEQRRLLEEARQEARNIVEAARARADEQAREILQAAQAEAQRLLEENRQMIAREREEALNAALREVADITVRLTAKLLQQNVTDAVHEKLLAEAEKKLGELVC
ncbi:hypothetical protein GCM10010885_20230 [Alicyclobacillus cellulosilyticus]|uniref:ATP synthase subunit b n=1 Tax=Alicyclobacillus cellulosilyticus TaxID=1003997 RepID=A0A917NM17_9BACL|nr:F0F1 ATP synthase subunit B [Alicyclobacillus cellulosilyticus]GGJ10953.1 hypothetical protein GCM10010885_20230 [Alicyclobacillus cellulosilyticus]